MFIGNNVIGIGLYGLMYGDGQSGGIWIPARLIIRSSDVEVISRDAAVVGWKDHVLASSFFKDGLLIASDGEPGIVHRDGYTCVAGTMEHTVYAVDYLVSRNGIYSEYSDDGIVIYYPTDTDTEFELEFKLEL